MLRNSVTRLTLDDDAAAFPSTQCWIKDESGELWWDLDRLHNTLRSKGEQRKRCKWVKQFSSQITALTGPGFVIRPGANSPEDVVRSNMARTFAILLFYWEGVSLSRLPGMKNALLEFLKNAAQRACTTIRRADDGSFGCRAHGDCNISRDGRVAGLFRATATAMRSDSLQVFEDHWTSLRNDGVIITPWNNDTHYIMDVSAFGSLFAQCRRWRRLRTSPACTAFVKDLRDGLLAWIACAADAYVTTTYHLNNPVVGRPPPSMLLGRKRHEISPEAALDLMHKALAIRVNVPNAIALRSDLPDLGCHSSVANTWVNRWLQMYDKRCSMSFLPEDCYHLNMVADPGHHSYKECLLSVVYSHEHNVGGYANWQHLLPGKALCTPFDSDIPEDMEEYVAARKLERVAAYRQLQGISKQIHLLTKNKLSIASYTLPDGCHVRAVAADEQRHVVSEHGRDHVFFVNTVTQARTRILPIGVHVFRLLVLMLDQGSIGCAGVAFATFQLGKLIHAKFDKIHRLVRDLKLSEQHAWPHQLFTKTKLWSAYLYALNNRPFSSGANATLKGMILNRFRISENITSAIFLKYLCRLAKDLHMPCEPDREKRAIFDRVLEMKPFLQKGSLQGRKLVFVEQAGLRTNARVLADKNGTRSRFG